MEAARHYPRRRGAARGLAALVVCAAGALGGDDERAPDVVELLDGERLEGRIVYVDDDEVVLRDRRGRDERTLDRAEIAELTTRRDALDDWLARVAQVDLEDPTALLELAAVATSRTLHDEAALATWLAATAESPDVGPAREALGFTPRRNGDWRGRVGRDTFTLAELDAPRRWSERVTLATEHVVIESSAPIRNAALLALDVAALHRDLRDHLSPRLRLLDPEQPLVVHLYGFDRDAPLPIERPDGAFLVADRTLHVPVETLAQRPDDVRRALAREFARQYLFEVTVQARRGAGPMPPWIDEALAGLASDGLRGGPAAARIDWTAAPRRAAALHVRPTTRRPERAGRVVGYGLLDLADPRHAVHRRARCTTLLHALRRADVSIADEVLRESLVGRSSFGRIEELYDRRADAIDALWEAEVTRVLGS